MPKRRRIEITAFRRTMTILADEPDSRFDKQSPAQVNATQPSDDRSAQFDETDVAEAILSTINDALSPELTRLIEALVVNNGDSLRAAEQVGLSRKGFYSKLRSLGLSIKHLKAAFRSSHPGYH